MAPSTNVEVEMEASSIITQVTREEDQITSFTQEKGNEKISLINKFGKFSVSTIRGIDREGPGWREKGFYFPVMVCLVCVCVCVYIHTHTCMCVFCVPIRCGRGWED